MIAAIVAIGQKFSSIFYRPTPCPLKGQSRLAVAGTATFQIG
jgi:hypothetical protein